MKSFIFHTWPHSVSIYSRLLLVVFITITGCCFAEVDFEEKNLFSCFGNYLKSQKHLDREFFVPEISNATDCDARLVYFREVFYAAALDELKTDDDMKEDAECIVDQMKKLSVADVSMKKIIYEKTRKLSKRKRSKAIKAIDYAIEKKMATAVKLCTVESTFSAAFTMLYLTAQSTKNDTEEEKIEDYCIRKYMTEGNFIDSNVYKLNLNPDNIDVTAADCDKTVKDAAELVANDFKEEFEDEGTHLSKRTEKCLFKTIKENKLFEASTKVVLLGEIGISDEAVEAEKKIYIQKMSELYDGIILCLL